jgi:primosomal protein N'
MTATNSPMGAQQAPTLQLNDIHLPEQINNFPMAIGWWLLALALIISLFLFIKYYQNKKRINLNKYKAIKQLNDNPNICANETIALLKWTAMQYFDRAIIANLFGDKFQHFLNGNLPQKHQARFIELSNPAFKQQYQRINLADNKLENETRSSKAGSKIDLDENCKTAALLWLKEALPVKQNTNKSEIGAPVHD